MRARDVRRGLSAAVWACLAACDGGSTSDPAPLGGASSAPQAGAGGAAPSTSEKPAPSAPAGGSTEPAGGEVVGTPPLVPSEPAPVAPEEEPALPADAPAELQLVEATLLELRAALATRLVTPAELAELYLTRIAAFDDDGPRLNAFLSVNADAVADANALGTRCEDADAPPLCGIPIVLKDNIDTADQPTTAGSLALAGSRPERDAFVTARLRAAGAVVLGKATLTEFANFLSTNMPSGYSSLGGFGFNPYDPRPQPGADGRPVLTPGGSSSGPAIAVSANLAAAGVGTETSGSILSPASSNGIVGIKPTLGLVSRAGILPISADQDTAGPLARSVADAALLLGVLAGPDPADPATSACEEPGRCETDYTRFLDTEALAGARIAVPPVPQNRAVIIRAAIERLEERGASVETIPQLTGQRVTCSSVPAPDNCSTVLIYGFKRDLDAYLAATPAAPVRSLQEIIAFNQQTEGALVYGQQFALAAQALDTSPDSADTARYASDRATALQTSRATLDEIYDGADGIPDTDDDIDALLFSENLGAGIPAIAGYPSITVPGGFVPPNGAVETEAPSGVTFSGRAFSEGRLIALAFAFEQATKFRRAPGSAPALSGDVVRRSE